MIRALLFAVVLIAQPELIDRTLALVGGQPIMLSDARAALALGLVDARLRTSAAPIGDTVGALIDRELMLREVRRYAPAPPAESAIDARLEELGNRFSDSAALTRVLEQNGISEVRLRAWVRDDLRREAYLAQRFASTSTPSEAEIEQAYRVSKPHYETLGQTFEQAAPSIREGLIVRRRFELINDWLSDLRRRTDIVRLPAQ